MMQAYRGVALKSAWLIALCCASCDSLRAAPTEQTTLPAPQTAAKPSITDRVQSDLTWAAIRFERTKPARSRWLARKNAVIARSEETARRYAAQLATGNFLAPALRRSCFSDVECYLVLEIDKLGDDFSGPADFRAAARKARYAFDAFRLALYLAERQTAYSRDQGAELEQLLRKRFSAAILMDQAYRLATAGALANSTFDRPAPPPPDLTAKERILFDILLRAQLMIEDDRNGKILEWMLDTRGWPAGDRSLSTDSWLIAQHSANPLLQLKALTLIREAIEQSPAEVEHYEFLADRLQLRLQGTQTYGTQFECVAHELRVAPFGNGTDLMGRRPSTSRASQDPPPQPARC